MLLLYLVLGKENRSIPSSTTRAACRRSRNRARMFASSTPRQQAYSAQLPAPFPGAALENNLMTEQNRKYITKEIGKLLSETRWIKGLAEPGVRPEAHDTYSTKVWISLTWVHFYAAAPWMPRRFLAGCAAAF